MDARPLKVYLSKENWISHSLRHVFLGKWHCILLWNSLSYLNILKEGGATYHVFWRGSFPPCLTQIKFYRIWVSGQVGFVQLNRFISFHSLLESYCKESAVFAHVDVASHVKKNNLTAMKSELHSFTCL